MTTIMCCEENYILDPEKAEINLDSGIYIMDVGLEEDGQPHLRHLNKLDTDMMYKLAFVDGHWIIETFEKIKKDGE